LTPECGAKELSEAYRAAAREKHPDRGGDHMEFYELSKAYAVLRDAAKRAKYDEYGERWVLQDAA
jgi:DnaJ-class molecular chaperone